MLAVIYRLIEATGREHLGHVGGPPTPNSYNDAPRVGINRSASDGNAMGRYIERYKYDCVGNFLYMQTLAPTPRTPAGSAPTARRAFSDQISKATGRLARGFASLELDDRTQIISYEEYTPYGSTT